MSNNSKYWIVTDLDGTLMDENYDISPAKKTLSLLNELDIPVIPCTSKTASEVRYFRKEYDLSDPYIVENGAAVYGLNNHDSSEWELILGKSYNELRAILINISRQDVFNWENFGKELCDQISNCLNYINLFTDFKLKKETSINWSTDLFFLHDVHMNKNSQSIILKRVLKDIF